MKVTASIRVGLVLAAAGSLAFVALAEDCWVCTSTCTEGDNGPCTGPSVTVCEDGASPAQPGEIGRRQLQPGFYTMQCTTYQGGTWYHLADCNSRPPGSVVLPCSTGTAGQCCVWSGGTYVTFSKPIQIQRCNESSDFCEVEN